MEFHQEFFKGRKPVMSPANHKEMNRKLQQANRAEKRKILHQQARNMPLTPKFNDFKMRAAASSTPMKQNQLETTNNKENLNAVNNEKSECKATDTELNKFRDTKNSRRLEYIQRFVAWKADKIQEEEKKQKVKKPFILVGKVKENSTQTFASFAPPNHVFHAPQGLKDPIEESEKHDSIYLAIPTPPKNNVMDIKNAPTKDAYDFKAKTTRALMIRNKINLATRTLKAIHQKQGNKAIIDILSNVPVCSDNITNAVGTTEPSKTPLPDVKENQNINTKVKPICRIDITTEQNDINKQSINKKPTNDGPTAAISRVKTVPQIRKEATSSAKENMKGYPKPKLVINTVRTAATSKSTTTKENGTQPISTVRTAATSKSTTTKENGTQPTKTVRTAATSKSTTTKENGAQPTKTVRTAATSKSTPTKENGIHLPSANGIAVSNQAYPCNENRTRSPNEAFKLVNADKKEKKNTQLITKKYTNDKPVGAVNKAKTMQQMRKNAARSTEENVKSHPKPKLATNFKAKLPLRSNKATDPKERDHIVTKKDVPCIKQRNEKKAPPSSEVAKFPSLINSIPGKAELPESTMAQKASKPWKFKFTKEVLFDNTIESPEAITMTEKNVNKKSSSISDVTESNIANLEEAKEMQNKEEKKNETKTKFNSTDALKISSKILQQLHLKNPQKLKQPQSPVKPKPTPKKLIDLESKSKQRRSKSLSSSLRMKENEESDMNERNPTNETTTKNNVTPEKISPTEGEEELRTPKQMENSSNRPTNYLSPFVSVSRGKVSAQKEKEKRNSIYLQETPTKNNDDTELKPIEYSIESRRALEAVAHFRQQLQGEIKRLHAISDQWDAYKTEQIELLQANCGEDMINVTVGQTRLLTSKKFMQFNSLIDRCEAHANGIAPLDDGSERTKTITPIDLEGFWSMLGLQIENIEKRFENLERWKSNNWEDPDLVKPKIRKVKKSKTILPSTEKNCAAKPRGNAALREMMLKKKAEMLAKNQQDEMENTEILTNPTSPVIPATRHLRRSTQNSRSKVNSSNPGRVCIVVPDRRSFSLARTIIAVPSPRNSPQPNELEKVTRSRCLKQQQKPSKTPSPERGYKSDAAITPQCSPMPETLTEKTRKSILKTPGTARIRSKSVVFNNHLSVKKFRCLKYDENHHGTEYSTIEQIHIDDVAKIKLECNLSSPEDNANDSSRVYRLRNRKVHLRPSIEIQLPK